MNIKSLRLIANLAITILSSLHANINNIKGTYDILKDEYKEFSVIHGAVAWETGTIRRMYDLGALGKTGSQIESKTIALIHQLFYRIPESTSITDFVVTKKIQTLPDADVILFVADVLLYLHNLPDTESFKKYQELFESYKAADEKKKRSLPSQGTWRVKIGEEAKASPVFAQYGGTLKNLLPFITNAELECAVEGYMPSYTPNLILLGLLYKKTNCSRDMLETYYKRLQEKIDCLNTPADWTIWKKDVFKKDDFDAVIVELQAAPPTNATIYAVYEKYVFVKLAPSEYPPIISYANAEINPKKEGKDQSDRRFFPDCMETTIRNLINFLCYNPQTKLFDPALLEQRLGTTIHPSLTAFYKKNPDPLAAGAPAAHNDWAQMVISNIPFVAYNSSLSSLARLDRGFIKIEHHSSEFEEMLRQKQYTVLQDTDVAYEIKASLKNFIIVLNHLFGFNLFENNLPQEFIKDDSIKKYLPKLVEKLKTTLPDIFSLETIDTRDYTSEQIKVPLTFAFEQSATPTAEQPEPYAFTMTIATQRGHGEVVFGITEEGAVPVPTKFSILVTSPISSLLLMPSGAGLPNAQTCFLWLFAQPIDDPDKTYRILNNNFPFDETILKLFLFIAKKNADPSRKTLMILKTYEQAIRGGLAENKFIVDEAIKTATNGTASTDSSVLHETGRLFIVLVVNDKAFDEATTAALTGIASTDRSALEMALQILAALVAKDKVFDEATNAASTHMVDEYYPTTQSDALDLFTALVAKDKAFEEATKAATTGIASRGPIVQHSALKLFAALVAKNKAFDEADKAAREGSISRRSQVQEAASQLSKAIKAAKATTTHANP